MAPDYVNNAVDSIVCLRATHVTAIEHGLEQEYESNSRPVAQTELGVGTRQLNMVWNRSTGQTVAALQESEGPVLR